MTIQTEIENIFATITVPDRRRLKEWVLDNVSLPAPPYNPPGELDLNLSPYLIEPLESLQSDAVREVVFCGSPRLGKTLIADAYCLYVLKNEGADILWCLHQKETLKSFYDTRLLKLLKHNDIFDIEIMERFDATQKRINLPNSTIRMVSVQNPNSLTALGSRVIIGDEVWRWNPGILGQVKNRSSEFRYTKKLLFISQAAEEGHDFHIEWKQGQQAHFGFTCPYCSTVQRYTLNHKRKDATFGGLTFDTNDLTKPNGIRDIIETEKTARYECIECRGVFKTDTDRRKLLKAGLYIPDNPKAPRAIRSYRCPAIASLNVSYSELVRGYLIAKLEAKRGKIEKLKNYYLQEMADFWSERFSRDEFQLKVGAIEDGDTKGDVIRFMTIDVQQKGNLLYYVICEFNRTLKTIKLVKHGTTTGFDEANKLWKDNFIKDQNVLIDSGDATRLVYRECSKRGHADAKKRWYCPTALRGADPKEGSYYNSFTKKHTFFSRPQLQDGNAGLAGGEKLYCPMVSWSNKTAKDILKALLDGEHPDWKLFMSDEALRDQDFKDQLNSEHVEFKDGRGRWVPNEQHPENHYWDCMSMIMVAGGICGFL